MGTFRNGNLVGKYLSETLNPADTPLSVQYGRWAPSKIAFTGIGYTCGGLTSGQEQSDIAKLTFSTDTFSASTATLGEIIRQPVGLGNGGVAGYIICGKLANGSLTSKMEKLLYSTEIRTLLPARLPDNAGSGSRTANFMAACGNADVAGYMGGGLNDSSGLRDVLDKFYFSTDTAIRLTSVLSVARNAPTACKNTNVAGYFIGGYDATSFSNVADKFSFSAETVSTLGTGLSVGRNLSATCDNASVASYVMAGNSSPTAETEKLSYVTDTFSTLSGSFFANGFAHTGLTNNSVSGYAHGGLDTNTYRKMPFATETVALLSGVASTYSSYYSASFSSGN